MRFARSPDVLRVDRYELHDELASGGMGTIHLGRVRNATGIARIVAIKRLNPLLARNAEFRTMFLDEARVASRVRHPNVVPTFDVVESGDEVMLVMELVSGESLSRLTRMTRERGVTIPPEVTCAIMSGALYGLHAAHETVDERGAALELVHRDVSPQNIMVGVDGIPRIIDFGVARAAGRLQTTGQGQLKGKLGYMAPEQLRGERIDRRTDVYAAGVVLWELLTLERLFEGDNEAHTLHRVLAEAVRRPSAVRPGIPEALDAIVLRALAPHSSDRYATAREMAAELLSAGRVAAPHEVAEWVEACAHERLAETATRVAELESDALDSRALTPPPQSPGEDEDMRHGSLVSPVARSRHPPKARWPWIGLTLVALLAVVGIARLTPGLRGKAEPVLSQTPSVPALSTAAEPPASVSSLAASSQAEPTATVTRVTETADAGARAHSSRPHTVALPAPTSTGLPARRAADCDPPYSRAADGTKEWKRECF